MKSSDDDSTREDLGCFLCAWTSCINYKHHEGRAPCIGEMVTVVDLNGAFLVSNVFPNKRAADVRLIGTTTCNLLCSGHASFLMAQPPVYRGAVFFAAIRPPTRSLMNQFAFCRRMAILRPVPGQPKIWHLC